MDLKFSENKLFAQIGLFLVVLGLLGVILTMLGIFYAIILMIYIILGLALLAYLVLKNRDKIEIDKKFMAVILASAGFVMLFSIFTTPTIFSGRDQGSLSEAAIRLVQNHRLEFSTPVSEEFFKIYGPGKALNFPGFNYAPDGNLITQFPLGYISWLAIFYSMFGLTGLIIANAVSFFIFLLSFYLLSRFYLKPLPAFISYLLVSTSFVFSWFFKFTLSENLALMLAWFGILQLVLFLKNKNNFYLAASALSFGLLIFTRIEAWFFLAVITLVLFIKYKNRFFEILTKPLVIIISCIALIFFVSLKINSAFYLTFAKGLLKSATSPIGPGVNPFLSILYVWEVLEVYALLPLIALSLMGFIYFLKQKKYELLIPFFIALPTFIYVIHPSISDDYPWMLRRFIFSIVPICILYSVIFLDKFIKRKYLFYTLSFMLLLSNLLIFTPYISFSENQNLLGQIENISTSFGSKDLVFIDQKATGDGFSMMAGPLSFFYGKQAVYFINPSDINKLDLAKFSHTYFIIPDDNLSLYEKSGLMSRLQPVKDYSIETDRLDIRTGKRGDLNSQPIELPMEQNVFVYGKIYSLN